MEFIRENTISVVNKDDAVIGDRYIADDTMEGIEGSVENDFPGSRLIQVKSDEHEYVFVTTEGSNFLLYPLPKKSYRSFFPNELENLIGEHVIQKNTNKISRIVGFHHVIDPKDATHYYYVSLDNQSEKATAIQLLDEYILHNEEVLGVAIEEE